MDFKNLLHTLDDLSKPPCVEDKPIIVENTLSKQIDTIKEERALERFDFLGSKRYGMDAFDKKQKNRFKSDRHTFSRMGHRGVRRLMMDDHADTVTIDIPLIIRLLEYAREDAHSDVDLHDVTENLIRLGLDDKVLTMDDYESIVGGIDKSEINESVSYDTTIRSIVAALGSSLSEVYSNLESAAEDAYYNEGDMKKFGLIGGGIGNRWVQTFYHNKLQHELYDLIDYKPKQTAILKDYLRKSYTKFSDISRFLPQLLIDIGKQINSKELYHAATQWDTRHKKFQEFIKKLSDKIESDKKEEQQSKKTVKTDNLQGKQSTQVEEVINSIFSTLPKNIVAELRPIIARSDSKLQTLMAELAKRGIK
jgi:hypothetical protein